MDHLLPGILPDLYCHDGYLWAKISKGRTIRQVSLCCLLGVSGGVWVLFGINGGFAMNAEISGTVKVTEILSGGAGQDMIYGVVSSLPGGGKILPLAMMLIIVGFVASSLDSASFSLAQTTTLRLKESRDVSKALRLFWCLVLTLVPLAIMFAKADFSALKSLAILVSIPFMFVVIFMEIVLFKWLREDTNKNKNEKSPPEVLAEEV